MKKKETLKGLSMESVIQMARSDLVENWEKYRSLVKRKIGDDNNE